MSMQWTLEALDDNLDVEDFTVDGETKTYLRHHWVAVRWRHELANSFPTDVGDESSVITMKCGDRTIFKGTVGALSGAPKYICVSDGISPEGEGQTSYVQRRQVWELYDEWILAPDHWQGGVL